MNMLCFKRDLRNILRRNLHMNAIKYMVLLFNVSLIGSLHAYTATETTVMPYILRNINNNITAFVDGKAILKCTVMNLGTKRVIWRKADRKEPLTIGLLTYNPDQRYQVLHDAKTHEWCLIIKDVQHSDAGVYECQISSRDRSIRHQVYLAVQDIEQGIEISNTTYVEKGDRLLLTCNATADSVEWFKKGIKVVTNEDKGIFISNKFSNTRTMVTSILEIEKATMDDDSDYVCRSSNPHLHAVNVKVHVLNAGTAKEKRVVQPTQTNVTGQKSNSADRISYSTQIISSVVILLWTSTLANSLVT